VAEHGRGFDLERWNEQPTPFVWTKEPADIIKKAVRRVR